MRSMRNDIWAAPHIVFWTFIELLRPQIFNFVMVPPWLALFTIPDGVPLGQKGLGPFLSIFTFKHPLESRVCCAKRIAQ